MNAATAAFTLRSTEGGTVSMSNNCGTVSPTSLDAGDNETFTLTGLTNGTSYSGCQVRVTDRGGNIATQALNSFTYDTTAITLDITDTVSGLTNQSSFTAYFAFNKPVESFVADNISLSHGTKGNLTAIGAVGGFADNYSMEITGVSNTVQITVAANAGRDNASNTGPANAVTHNVSYDGALPGVRITDNVSGLTNQSSFTAYFAFNELVSGFAAADITVDNGTKGTLTQIAADNYSMVITGVSNNVVITVAANAASDNASNTGPADAVSHSVTYVDPDSTSPTIQIQDAPTTHDQSTGFGVTFAFSEAVQGFVADDVSLGHATISQFTTTDNISFTATITPTGAMDITIDVAANVAQDAAGNTNSAATRVSVRSDVVEETQELIDTSLKATISHIVSNQPSLGGSRGSCFPLLRRPQPFPLCACAGPNLCTCAGPHLCRAFPCICSFWRG